MAELDNIPQKQSVEIEIVKLEESVLTSITELNQKINAIISDFGNIYIRKKEIEEELKRLDTILEESEAKFKLTNEELKEILDVLDDKYPQGRINLQDGLIQYQPGVPSRKQLAEQQKQQTASNASANGMKVVKE
jgi:isopenicillin N synthase-like dioxygenase